MARCCSTRRSAASDSTRLRTRRARRAGARSRRDPAHRPTGRWSGPDTSRSAAASGTSDRLRTAAPSTAPCACAAADSLHHALREREPGEQRHERSTDQQIAFHECLRSALRRTSARACRDAARPCTRCPARPRRCCRRRGTVPGYRPPLPNAPTGASVSRCRMWTFLSWPLATNTNRCCGSFENAMSHADPYDDTTPNWPVTTAPSVFFETTASRTNLPSFRKT